MKIDEDKIVLGGVTYWRLWYNKCKECYSSCRECSYFEYDRFRFWYCKQCGGDVFIGDNAMLFCKDCGWSEHVSKTKFNCTYRYEGEDDTVETSACVSEFYPSNIRESILRRAGTQWVNNLIKNYWKTFMDEYEY